MRRAGRAEAAMLVEQRASVRIGGYVRSSNMVVLAVHCALKTYGLRVK
jgi:hypothetical protein